MKKVLMISYSFPPIAGGGVFRTLKFVKFLPNFGYDSVVLSVKKSKFKDFDETLLNAIPSTTNVYRAKNIESKIYRYAGSFFHINYKWYQIPDVFITWLPFALNKAKYIVKKEKPSVIYSTSPPATSHIIAMLLKKKTKLPWVADFRDPWTDNFIIKYPTKFHRKLEEKLEKKVLKLADKVILNTESNKDALLKKYPDINKEKFIVITNGYDLDDFENIELSKTNNFTIASVGSFYDEMNPRI
ncbi:MAG: glycosyltransferase, partial [Thermoplasmatales archaeon]|nr:glycosyltransferase [Thermoplasmatales archaeon]